MKTIYLAGGCFWGVEKYLSLIPGVLSTEAGYANGKIEAPTYEEVCRQDTGHAEAVKVLFDDHRLSLEDLLARFFEVIDPIAVNRQGNDVGRQYRTGVYYTHPEDQQAVLAALERLRAQYTKPIAVEAEPLENYWPAEEEHQNYLDRNPGGYCHIPATAFQRAKRPPASGDQDALKSGSPRCNTM